MRKAIIIAARAAAVILAAPAFFVMVTDVTDACPAWLALVVKGASLAVLTACSWLLPPVRERFRELGYEPPFTRRGR